jgi:hypothetical protein
MLEINLIIYTQWKIRNKEYLRTRLYYKTLDRFNDTLDYYQTLKIKTTKTKLKLPHS